MSAPREAGRRFGSAAAVYGALHQLIAAAPVRSVPRLTASESGALRRVYDGLPDTDASDGIVPTLSQVWGPVIHAAAADHLDAIGHFPDASCDPPHVD